jgi:hypothetical protein
MTKAAYKSTFKPFMKLIDPPSFPDRGMIIQVGVADENIIFKIRQVSHKSFTVSELLLQIIYTFQAGMSREKFLGGEKS